jgi:hypothetical protein
MSSTFWIVGAGLLAALAALVLGTIGLGAWGERRWAAAVQLWQQRLEGGRIGDRRGAVSGSVRYDERELEGLPGPVQRYFRTVLSDGQPIISAVTLELAGRFNLSATGEQWRPFTSRQRVITRRAGFLWDARIAMLPGLTVRVVDSYILGRGLLLARALGLFTLADVQGEGDIAGDEYMRWFAEAPWYPTALLPSQGVRWEAVDSHSAHATVVDGPLTLTLLFRFNDAGLISSLRAEARGSLLKGQRVLAPCEGSWSNYRVCEGVRVPLTGEVAWMRPEGRRPYFVGTVTTLHYELLLSADGRASAPAADTSSLSI